jgi:nucleotide-binding universal stress UspA family protein
MSRAPEPPHKAPYNRLVIGFNHHMECRSVLNFAAQVAQVAGVELAGVFVEDQELLDLARLPFSTEVLTSSRQTRNLDATSMEGELRAIALQMHNALRKLAEHTRRQYSFRTVRGHLLHALIAQAGAGDLLLLRTADFAWRGARPAMAFISGPVVLLEPPGSGNGNLVSLAQEIARTMKQEIVIEHKYAGPQTLRGLNEGLIIVPGTLFTADDDIERFVAAAPCPVLLVPASV